MSNTPFLLNIPYVVALLNPMAADFDIKLETMCQYLIKLVHDK